MPRRTLGRVGAPLASAIALVTLPVAAPAAPRVINDCAIAQRANCPRAALQGQNLRGADLRRANLKGANFRGTDLRKAKLRGANLAAADFTGAVIRGADFSYANLRGAKLVKVVASAASGAEQAGLRQFSLGPQCSLQPDANGSMYGADLQNATMSGQYTYWYFAHAKMSGVKAEMTNFYCSTFTSVTAASYAYVSQGSCVNPAEKTDFASASFVGADLTSANLSGWAAVPTTTQKLCTGGNYTPASTYSPDFSRTNFSNATLTKANLANTVLPSTAYDNYLKGAIWSSTTCPQGNVATGAACSPRSP